MNLRRWFARTPVVLTPSTRHGWEVDSRLEKRQMEARSILVVSGKNIDRGPLDYERDPPPV